MSYLTHLYFTEASELIEMMKPKTDDKPIDCSSIIDPIKHTRIISMIDL